MSSQSKRFSNVELTNHPDRVQNTVDVQHGGRSKEGPVPDLPVDERLERLLELLLIPGEQGQSTDIQIELRMVRRSMMAGMTALPPIGTSSHQKGIEQDVSSVVLLAVEEN